jgi:hypothetical protein
MINLYIDPFSEVYLGNKIFGYDKLLNRDDCLSPYRYLKNYCLERDININTVDLWNEKDNGHENIIVSFNHKKSLALKNKNNKFFKKILYHFEPPVVTPSVYKNINDLFKIYDEIFFSCILDNSKCGYFNWPQPHNNVIPNYWENTNRAFLTMINMNKKPYSRHKELYSQRIKAVKFFGRTNDIDLYGFGWDKRPYFPYWFYKSDLQKVHKGSVETKFSVLSKYNFAICFENMIMPGFVTEKIFDSFFAGTIPVYWGAPDIEDYIPKECFIDMRDFKNYAELRRFLKSITKSEIVSYKENARKYLESEQFEPYTKEYFAEMFVDAIKEDGEKDI